MNRYDFWRFFGPLPKPPDAAYIKDPDKALSALIARYRNQPDNGTILSEMVSCAFIFCRLDSLSEVMSHDDWDNSPSGAVYRAWLRYYRALAENPESPEAGALDQATSELQDATGFSESRWIAHASLVRVVCLKEGYRAALAELAPLERHGWLRDREFALPAVAGARLFLADFPGVRPGERRRHLHRARFSLIGALAAMPRDRNPGRHEEYLLLLSLVERQMGRWRAAENRLRRLAEGGSTEARYLLLRNAVENPSSSAVPGLLDELSEYRNRRPSDPRAFILEGDLTINSDPETARLAWRSALVLDERSIEAWVRLGDLYKEAWDRGDSSHRDMWLEAAGDSYLKAVSLDPLDPGCRLRLGIVERQAGRPARALVSVQGAMALVSDDPDIRRWLALCWIDMAYSSDLTDSSRAAAARRAREEWERLIGASGRKTFDLMGLLRSLVLEILWDSDTLRGHERRIDSLLTEILSSLTEDMLDDLLDLNEDFLRCGMHRQAATLLERITPLLPEHPKVLTAYAILALNDNPEESAVLFQRAAKLWGADDPASVECLLEAADAKRRNGRVAEAEGILRDGLHATPDNEGLVRGLAEILISQGKIQDAVNAYDRAINSGPENTRLVEDGAWLSRDLGVPDFGKNWLLEELRRHPNNARLWNQLGVHYMETGWDEAADGMGQADLEKAIAVYRRAVELEPDNIVYLGNLGDALRQDGKWTEAAEVLGQAAESTGRGDEGLFALNSMARLLDERSYASEGTDSAADDWMSSGEYYRRAASRGRANPEYIRDYAWWLYRERRLEEAIDQYRRAAMLDPVEDGFPYGESMCWRELGDNDRALASLDRALELKPGDAEMTAEKADLLGEIGKTQDGERLYSDLLRATGGEAWIWDRLATFREERAEESEDPEIPTTLPTDGDQALDPTSLYSKAENRTSVHWRRLALAAWEEASVIDPDNRLRLARMGAAWMDLGFPEKARETLKKSLSHDSRDATTHNRLGRLCLTQGEMETSIRHLTEAVDASPLDAGFWADLGYAEFLKGAYQSAGDAFHNAWERDSENGAYAANAGISLYRAGDFSAAVKSLRRAVMVGSDRGRWLNALGLALLASGDQAEALEAFRAACIADPVNGIYTANLKLAHETLHSPGGPLQ